MYIYSYSNHIEPVTTTISEKKSRLEKKVNRADNYTNLALLGAQQCLKDVTLDTVCNLYIASNNGNLNSTYKVFETIFAEKQLPMPFTFLNTVNASIIFLIAKNFDIQGKSLFVDSFESALPQAYIDVIKGRTVILGVVDEVFEDVALHKKRFNCDSIEERSCWLVLSNHLQGQSPLAEITDFSLNTLDNNATHQSGDITDLLQFLESDKTELTYKTSNLSFNVIRM